MRLSVVNLALILLVSGALAERRQRDRDDDDEADDDHHGRKGYKGGYDEDEYIEWDEPTEVIGECKEDYECRWRSILRGEEKNVCCDGKCREGCLTVYV